MLLKMGGWRFFQATENAARSAALLRKAKSVLSGLQGCRLGLPGEGGKRSGVVSLLLHLPGHPVVHR